MPTTVSRPISVSLPPVGVYFAESVHAAQFEMQWRRDPFHKCLYVLDGRTSLEQAVNRRSTPLGPASLALVPAELEHRLCDLTPSTLLLLCIATEVFDRDRETAEVWRALSPADVAVLHLDKVWQRQIESLWRQAMVEQIGKRPGWQVATRTPASRILLYLLRLPAPSQFSDVGTRVHFVARELEASFFEPWSLDRAAALAGISRRAFSSHFRRLTGQSFLQRLNELRLEHAAKLLGSGHHSITGAAFSCGFQDLSHFYRSFRNRFGCSPKSWSGRPQV